ncbi:helix-turn-helix transcriptional regulator [Spirosoma sp. BT702]|uniref:Helix-turn-helix transcriptional regulator n=1 Tax=Spirosoma profusum TaxID=2771354 RepID=A0A927AVI6_9BACT|nr:helix-turn-helix transcriptional regulator [Spirosoma profusum]MBD2705192.1 helix-turn-helix transcriptional regulator [Spirosoma profusum]
MINLSNGQYLGVNKKQYEAGGLILTETEYHTMVFEGWHAHNNVHISLIIKGRNREERQQKTMIAQPGTLLFYHQDEFHRNLHTNHPSKNINLEITGEFMKCHELGENGLETITRHPNVRFSLLKMFWEAGQADQLSAVSIQMLLLELLDLTRGLTEKQPPKWLRTLLEFLQDNWQQPPTLSGLAILVGVNPITISKHFSRYMGCTLGEYLQKLKVQHALQLIATGMPLTEVAYSCGFADQSHFIRNFREQTGFLPKIYQKL